MKKLLKLLTASLIISFSLSGTIYACGNTPEGTAPVEKKTEKIDTGKNSEYADLTIASEILGISTGDLKEALKTKSLYELLDDAEKVDAFKKALINNFKEKIQVDYENGLINKTKSEKLIQKFTKKVNDWNG